MEKLWRTGVRARTARETNFFDSRHIVCQITGKNSAEFKNYVKNRFCGRAGVRRARKTNILKNMN